MPLVPSIGLVYMVGIETFNESMRMRLMLVLGKNEG